MKTWSLEDKAAFYDALHAALAEGSLSTGQVLRKLRTELLGVDQATFARIGKVSVRTLRALEADRGNPSIKTLNGLLRPFGLHMAIAPRPKRL